jgi:hypothetical protein
MVEVERAGLVDLGGRDRAEVAVDRPHGSAAALVDGDLGTGREAGPGHGDLLAVDQLGGLVELQRRRGQRRGRADRVGRGGHQACQSEGHGGEADRGDRGDPRTDGVSGRHAGLTRGPTGWFTRIGMGVLSP